MSVMRCVAVLMLVNALWLTPVLGDETDAGKLLQQAVETYQAALENAERSRRLQLFGQAEALFAKAALALTADHQQPPSADLLINLGNAALGAEHLGSAILAYRQSLQADPGNRRAQQNLAHARTLLPNWVPKPDDDLASSSFFNWTRYLRSEDWLGVAAVVFLIASFLTALYLARGKSITRNLAVVFGLVWLGTLLYSFATSRASGAPAAVVIIDEVIARSADSVNSPARFAQPLPGGSEVRIQEDRGYWMRVQLADSRECWLPASALQTVELKRIP